MWRRFFKLLFYIVLSLYVVSFATLIAVLRSTEWHQELLRFSPRVWFAFLAHVGSTGPGFVSPIIVSVLSVALTMVCIGVSQGWAAMLRHWWETALYAGVVLVTTMLAVYGPQFVWQAARLARDDHRSAIASNGQLLGENKDLHDQLTDANKNAEKQCEQAKDKEINRLKRERNAACFNPDRKLTKMEEEELFSDLKRIRVEMERQKQTPVYRMYSFNGDRESGAFALDQLMPIFRSAGWTIKVAGYSQLAEENKKWEDQQKWMFDHGLYEGLFVFDKNWPKGFGVQVGLALSKVDLTDWMQSNQELTKELPHLEDLTIWVGYKHTTRERTRPMK